MTTPATAPRLAPPPDPDQRNDALMLSVGEKSAMVKFLEADKRKVTVDSDGVLVKEIHDWRQLGHIIEILAEGKDVRLRFKDGEPAELRDGKTMRQFLVEIQACKVSEMLLRSRDILSARDGRADLTEALDFFSYTLDSKRDKPITVREIMDLRRASPSSIDWDGVERSIREKINEVAKLPSDVPRHDVVVWTSECTQDKVAEITAKIWNEVKDGSSALKTVMLENAHVWPYGNLSPVKDPLGEMVTERSMSIFHDFAEKEREAHSREKARTLERVEEWQRSLQSLAERANLVATERQNLVETRDRKIQDAQDLAARKKAEADAAAAKLYDPNDPDLVRLIEREGLRQYYVGLKKSLDETAAGLREKESERDQILQRQEQLRQQKEELQKQLDKIPDDRKNASKRKKIEQQMSRIPAEDANLTREISEIDEALGELRKTFEKDKADFETNIAPQLGDILSPSADPALKNIPDLEAEARTKRQEAERAAQAAATVEEDIRKQIDGHTANLTQMQRQGHELQQKIGIGTNALQLLETSRTDYDAAKESSLQQHRAMLKQIEQKEAEAAAAGPGATA